MKNKRALRLGVRLVFALLTWLSAGATASRAQSPSPAPSPAPAQPSATPTPAPSTSPTASASGAEPDLSITATVTARELRFEKVPNPKVEFTGKPKRDTVWESDRQNLPPQVRPGETYRDIGIRLRITSVFADIERIVAEALGEVPATDDAPPSTSPPTSPPLPPSSITSPPASPSPAAALAPRSRTNGARGTATTRRRGNRP